MSLGFGPIASLPIASLPVAAGADVTIDCTPGNAVAAGISCTFDVSLSCTPGNAVAAGISCTFDVSISCTPGDAVADGVDCAIETSGGDVTIDCTPGNAVADGVACSIDVVGTTEDRASGGFAWLEYISERDREQYRKKRREIFQKAPKKVEAIIKKVVQKAAIEKKQPETSELVSEFKSQGVPFRPNYAEIADKAYQLYIGLLIDQSLRNQADQEKTRRFIAEQEDIARQKAEMEAAIAFQGAEDEAIFMVCAALLLD